MHKKSRFYKIQNWAGLILLLGAGYYFYSELLPNWQPKLEEFWNTSGQNASRPLMLISFALAWLGYYFAPLPWQKILEALKIPRIDRGELRRNWYITQMGSYMPGKLWMVLGRLTFLRVNGTSTFKGVTALVLENIYMLVALGILALVALPFLGSDLPGAVTVALWVSAGLAFLMLFAPGLQKLFARKLARKFDVDLEELPHISHMDQFKFIGAHILSWFLRSLALYVWFRGFGVPASTPPYAMVAVCLLAAPASWLIALVMVFIPGGIGVRESIRGLFLAPFVVGGMAVATTIALAQRATVILVEILFASQAVVYQFLCKHYPVQMNHLNQLSHLSWSAMKGWLCRHALSKPPHPINVTFSVTSKCQSRCKTCFIWKESCHEKSGPDLGLATIERLFRSIGWTYFFNVSGGEPFLRNDLTEIVRLACRHLRPAVVHIPTNALMPERIEETSRKILEVIREEAPGTVLTIKPSFDGIGNQHDEIRGIPGNFEKLLNTLERLKALREQYEYLHVGVGTVVSRFNQNSLKDIIAYADTLKVNTYINEIAEEREEFFNLGSGITPDEDSYRKIMLTFKENVRRSMRDMKLLSRITTAMRLIYYDLATDILRENKQVIPCYAGILNVHINSDGEIWPCAVLAYKGQMGRIGGDTGFLDVWNSKKAAQVRKNIKAGECACPLANQAYSNIIMDSRSLLKTIWIAIRG
ncbi:MAG: lysylphosphatidylglycerol synthase domain-containing protein [Candidatus Sabulitectum sp.]|nr:lysylphosphatidylglycerol synthase domain-containing protein [Candidatus Sabulitectum sp.]